MLEAFKRWLHGGDAAPRPDWDDVAGWASRQGHAYKRAHHDEGFVIDGSAGERPWRLEWGPPQRNYVVGHELRMRMELALPAHLQMLVLTRSLMERLERETFERYTEGMQTQIDVTTPEEMRWLAMFPKAPLELPRELRAVYGAVAADPAFAVSWVDPAFADALAEAAGGLLREAPPWLVMTLRGRVYLRMALAEPSVAAVEGAVRVFVAAVEAAQRTAAAHADRGGEWGGGSSTAWQDLDGSERRRR